MGGGGGDGDTVQRSEPPTYVKPYITGDPKQGILGVLPEAQRLYEGDMPQYFPGSTVAGFSPAQMQAMQLTANRAMGGSPYMGAAGQEMLNTLGGQYLNYQESPYMDQVYANIESRVLPSVAGQYSAAGRSPGGSGLYADTATRALSDAFSPIAMQDAAQNYARERGYMQSAMGMAPQFAMQDYADISQLMGVGGMQQAQAQRELGADVEKFNFYQNLPQTKLDNYLRAVYGSPGMTTYTSGGGGGGGVDPYQLAGLGIAAAGMFMSDPEVKENVEPLDENEILGKIIDLPVSAWNYIGDDKRHIGPMADDFQESFGVGDGHTIAVQDAIGILMAGQKAIAKKLLEDDE